MGTKKQDTENQKDVKPVEIERLVMPDTISLSVPSVFKGEVPFLTLSIDGKDVGKLWGTGGVLTFEGDCEESAKIFFEQVIELNRAYLEA